MLLGEKYEIINNVPMTCYDGIGGAKFILVNTFTEFLAFHELLMKRKIVFCDTETTGFHYYNGDRIIGMSFGWLDTHFYLPVRHQPSLLGGEQPPQLDMDEIRPYLQEFFAQEDVSVVFHHLKFDEIFYLMDDIHIKCKKHDTLILWKLFNEEAPGNLETIATGWTDIMGRWNNGVVGKGASDYAKGLTKWRNDEAKARRAAFNKMITEMTKEARSELRFNGMKAVEVKAVLREEMKDHPYANVSVDDIGYQYVPIPQMTVYAASDTFYTYKIFVHVLQNMRLEGKLKALYDNELAVSDMLRDLQMQGLRGDREYFERKSEEYAQRIADLEREIMAEMGVDPDSGFNLGSNDQLAEALVNMGVPLVETTETGKLKVDKKVLTKIAPKYPIVRKILDLRALQKLKGTYFDSLLEKMGPDGVIHASFNQNVSTGRFSSSSPNFTNMPRGPEVRSGFLNWSDEYIYFFADYSQVEVRLLAHMSDEAILKAAYLEDRDIHLSTACSMFGYNYDEALVWLKDEDHEMHHEIDSHRTISKIINFSIAYGASGRGLSEQIPRPKELEGATQRQWIDHCESFITRYFDTHLEVKRFINRTQREVKNKGYLVNPFGRVRRLPHVNARRLTGREDLKWLEGRAMRQGPNFLIQSTAGDVFKTAAVRVHKIFQGTKSKICNLVHDDINCFIHKDEFVDLVPKIKHAMEDFDFSVPLKVDMAYSTTNWHEKRHFGLEDTERIAAL